MAGYTRQSTFADGDTITAALFNNEYNQLLNAFSNTGGHKHDGTANEGPVIGLIGDAGVVTPLNKVLIDSTNDHIEFWIDVSSSSVQQLYIADGAIVPVTDNDIDLGTSSLQFKDLYINGTANIDSLVLATGSTVTAVLDEDDLSSDSATSLVTQQSVKAYIDAQVTAQDLDFLGDSGGALSIDLDSESLTIAGGTGLDTVGSGNTVTVNIDATVATLTGSQTLTNKTIDVDNNTVSNIEVDNFKASAIVLESEGIGSNDNDTSLPTSAAVKDYVDTQITAEDLDITTDSGTIAIDLDSETLTVSGGTGLDSSATGNAVTLAIDSTVTTLTGTQTLTNKTLTSPDVNTPDIDGGTIDGATIATSDVTVGAGKTLDVSAGTLTLADNQISGDKVEGGTIAATTITDLTFGSLNDGTITATAFVDEDNMASNSATLIPTQQSVKAYVDTTVAATNEVVEDTTPQLGGDLASNGNDILFADNDKAIFGAGSDLQIYSDGTNGIIRENTGGSLYIAGADTHIMNPDFTEYYISAFQNGAVWLRHDNSLKLATTSTGIDVTGTVVADGLTVDGEGRIEETGAAARLVVSRTDALNTAATASVDLLEGSAGGSFGSANNYGFSIDLDGSNNTLNVLSGNQTTVTKRLSVARDTGDISFYDDTGTSQALFWDAGAEKLGIGTTSPAVPLEIAATDQVGIRYTNSTATSTSRLYLTAGTSSGILQQYGNTHSTNANEFRIISTAGDVTIAPSSLEQVRVTTTGNVGIGTTSPTFKLDVAGNARASYFALRTNESAPAETSFIYRPATGTLAFGTASTEKMRIDSSGNVGIGTDSPLDHLHINDDASDARILLDGHTGYDAELKFAEGGVVKYSIGHDSATDSFIIGTTNVDTQKRLVVDSSGNVGIGTSSISGRLEIKKATASNETMFAIEASGVTTTTVGSITYDQSDDSMRLLNNSDFGGTSLRLGTRGNDNVIIDYSGNVGIGRTSIAQPSSGATTLAIQGTDNNKAGAIRLYSANDSVAAYIYPDSVSGLSINTSTSHPMVFRTAGTERMRILSGGGMYMQSGYQLGWGSTANSIAGSSSTNSLGFYTNSSERIRINSSGNVGIGTSSPSATLDVNGHINLTDGYELKWGGAGATIYGSNSNNQLRLYTNNSERMRIDSSGDVGVGATTVGARLHVRHEANRGESSPHFQIQGAGYSGFHWLDGTAYYVGQNSNARALRFYSGSNDAAGVNLGSGATSFGTYSDERLKENIQDIGSVIEKIKDIRCVTYNRKDVDDENKHETIGFIAQDFIGKFDQVLDESKVLDSDEETRYSMRYTETIPILMKAIQEQQTQIDALQSEINNLKGE